MTKFEIIFELLKAMNRGDSGYINERVSDAIKQYEQLVEKGIYKETEEEENDS